jgi:CO/xanthine dehydrogenase Mo-binding subunit
MYKVVKGDIKTGDENCDIIAEGEVRYDKFPTPLPIENPICIAKWEDDGSLSAWVSTQAPHLCRTSNSLSMGGIRLNVKAFNVGGSFGSKVAMTEQVFYAAAASRAAGGAPVRWRETKSDHLLSHDLRLGTILKGRIGMTKEGIVDLVDAQLIVDTGYTSDLAQGIGSVGLGEVQLVLAKCKNWNLVSRVIATNRTFSGAVRGFGGQEMKSVVMLLWQDAMIELGIDPVECFKKNIVTPGDTYTWRDNHDYTCYEVNFIPAIDKTAEAFGWKDKWKGWLKPTSVNGNKARGVGVSLHLNADAGEDNTTAYVRIDHLGYVTVHHGGAEFGQAQRSNAMVKVAAEALNVPFEKVSVVEADTRSTPGDFGLQGSRGTKCVESAIWKAAKDCYQKILEHASELIFHNEVPPEALEFKDGFITIKGKADMEPIPIIAAMVDPFSTITGFGEYREDFTTPNFFLNFVEVEVDLDTGYADVVELAGGTDVGQIIDPVQLSMQIDGGIGAAGLDTAFFEGHVLDTYTGRNLTTNMIDYKMRPFNQFPKYDKKVIMESQFDVSPIKALGCGEITGAASPGAVIMAISNAIGAKVRDYPATPEVILKAMNKIR